MTESSHSLLSVPVLDISDLSVGYSARHHAEVAPVVKGVSLTIESGQTLALVGQSGSGKTTIAQAVAGLLPANGHVLAGRIALRGSDVVGLSERRWRGIRGRRIGYIPQDPLGSLDPLKKVGDFVARSFVLHRGLSRAQARSEAVALLDRVGIRDAARRAQSYPHELSGGQLQRVLIAAAVAGNPSLLIADEPTSALDVTVQAVILDLIDELQSEFHLGVLFITHNLALAKDRSDSVVVLREATVVEQGVTSTVLARPQAAYTQRLITDAPGLSGASAPRLRPIADDHPATPAIRVSGLSKSFFKSTGFRGVIETRAVDNVSLSIPEGTIHAVVGESGSGKTTLARIIAGLSGFDTGEVEIAGRSLPAQPPDVNPNAKELQLVYQNALAALDPRFTVERSIREPLDILNLHAKKKRRELARDALARVRLDDAVLSRRPQEISGGQRQRVAIARALILEPKILVLDEPTSALDVTIQAQIIELLLDLQSAGRLTYVYISHDLGLVRTIADEVSVLDGGQLVETGSVDSVFTSPRQAYTQRLLEAVPGNRTRAVGVAGH
jgi:peptide/nickel transport system ATP-binding protein